MKVLLINARSLSPKLYSMVDTMHEINAHIALVTETWFKDMKYVEEQLENMKNALEFACIRKDREGVRTGGGVAIIYKTGDLGMQQIRSSTRSEIVAAVGRRIGQRCKIVVINAYIPPSLDAAESDQVLSEVSDLVGSLKGKYNAPYFLIEGDFN